jgi:hypothetical protein
MFIKVGIQFGRNVVALGFFIPEKFDDRSLIISHP